MKKLLVLLALTAILFSCKKDITSDSSDQPTPNSQIDFAKGGGLLEDPIELKSKFKFIASEEFARNGKTIAFVKGKKVFDGTAIEANSLMMDQAKGPSKGSWTGGGGNGGGGGGTKGNGGSTDGSTGGGGTIILGDVTPPHCAVTSPTAGYVYNIKSGTWNNLYWDVIARDESRLTRIVVKIRGDVVKDTSGPFNTNVTSWNVVVGNYNFPYGDGIYDVSAQAWDAAGNTTISTVVVSRNTQWTPLPYALPSAYTMAYMNADKYINQGGEGSCASFTVANAYGIERYNRGLTGGFNDNNVYSAEWLYNLCIAGWRSSASDPSLVDCGFGSGIIQNTGYLVNRGVPTWGTLPNDKMNGCDTTMFTDAMRANASLNRGAFGDYFYSLDRNLMKLRLTQNKPGMISFTVDYNYMGATPGFIWSSRNYNGGPHSMVVVGYDDSKHAYLCLNSWGSAWGTTGAIWVDYDFFDNNMSGVYNFGNF